MTDDVGFIIGEDIGRKGRRAEEEMREKQPEDVRMYGVTYGGAGGGVPGWGSAGMGAGPAPVSGAAPYGRRHGHPISAAEAEQKSEGKPPPPESGAEDTGRKGGIDAEGAGSAKSTSSASPRRGIGAEEDYLGKGGRGRAG